MKEQLCTSWGACLGALHVAQIFASVHNLCTLVAPLGEQPLSGSPGTLLVLEAGWMPAVLLQVRLLHKPCIEFNGDSWQEVKCGCSGKMQAGRSF